MRVWRRMLGERDTPPRGEAPPAAPDSNAAWLAESRWLESGENAFGVRCLDCRAIAARGTDAGLDAEAAARFARSRRDDGAELRGLRPDDATAIACRLQYPLEPDDAGDGWRFRAESLEERWDVLSIADAWVFARSASGRVVYRAPRRVAGSFAFVESIEAEGDAARADPSFCVREVDYLVKSHLFDFGVPHPLPRGLRGADAELARFSFRRHGRRGLFATEADTLAIDPWALTRRGAGPG